MINNANNNLNLYDFTENNFQFKLSEQEKKVCLKEIIIRLKKILYVYEKSLEPNSTYDYRIYCSSVLLYVSSSNMLFNGELVSIVVNLNSILTNNFDKKQIKKLVLESVNYAQYLLSNQSNSKENRDANEIGKVNESRGECVGGN